MIKNVNNVRFKPKNTKNEISLNIEDGLFNASSSGLCALNLALITGANPIYIVGIDGTGTANNHHYKESYTGETKTDKMVDKYAGNIGYYKYFEKYKDRIKNLSKESLISIFEKVELPPKEKLIYSKEKKSFTVCHVMTFNEMEKMGDISRQIFDQTDGKHIYCNINQTPPKADIYLLECFINGWNKYKAFRKPEGSKVVSLIHSSGQCQPADCSDKTITITNSWKEIIRRKFGKDSDVIYAGIDSSLYNKEIDYTSKGFGRITRYSQGKIHPQWNNVAKNILDYDKDSYCVMITSKESSQLKHERYIIDDSVKINEHEKKVERLAGLSIYADMHNTFVETFSLGLLEAMATGLCIVLYSASPQPAMVEVLGNTGIICKSVSEFEGTIKELLNDTHRKSEYGKLAKERAKMFSIDSMVNKYNRVFNELIRGK
jgi:glycosyltransferase involved in cell wall biosynthesis